MDKAHIVPKQAIKRELRARGEKDLRQHVAVWARGVWQPSCRRHHGLFDRKLLRVPHEAWPAALHEWGRSHDLAWLVDRYA